MSSLNLPAKCNMEKDLSANITCLLNTVGFWGLLGGLVGAMIVHSTFVIAYRLFFSPLAKFPGPKLAAATAWYETFFDLWNNNFPDVLADMHAKYGMFR